ncbi:MAG: imidazole glycerol phosphate synthase subunit HisH [Deltaproteobacteria bacterium]|nr:MAG: imidazole glycerol phosphate synthase subunit HisH [Deltaproteobacteria bacterium]
MSEALVVPTGTANLASVLAGLRRAGLEPELSVDPAAIAAAPIVVLPGVGHFKPAIEGLREAGLVQPLRDRVRAEKPLLAICLGLQVLAEGSDEAPGVEGLGVLPGHVRRFPEGVRCPHLGWTYVQAPEHSRLLRSGFANFAHSYRLSVAPAGWHAAIADHEGPFVAAVERGPILACQLHPELSGQWGADLLARWVALSKES